MKSTQRGMSLLETMGALAIGSLLLMGLVTMMDSSMEDVKGQQAAVHQAQVVSAARKYIAANYDTLRTNTAGGATVAITLAQLRTGRFLSNSFPNTNAYLQTPCVLVRQPNPDKLDALIATSGGQAIPEREIRMVAMYAGQGGGYISTAAPDRVRGPSWEMITTNYRGVSCGGGAPVLTGNDGGRLASNLFYDGPGQLATDFLYRSAVAGRPELNRMTTGLRMGGDALVNIGDDCNTDLGVPEPGIAMDSSTRRLLSCGADGLWRELSQWKEAKNNYAALPIAGSERGDVRMVTGLNRAFTFNGAGWVALAVDQNGDMNIPNDLTAGTMDSRGTIHADDHISTDRDMNVARNATIGMDLTVRRNARIQRDLDVDQNLNVDRNLTVNRDARIVQNLRVNRDVTIDNNLNVGEVTTTKGMWADKWAYASAYSIGSVMAAGGRCNIFIGYDPEGRPMFSYPTGVLVRDGSGLVMSCGAGDVFRYENGTFTP